MLHTHTAIKKIGDLMGARQSTRDVYEIVTRQSMSYVTYESVRLHTHTAIFLIAVCVCVT